MQLNNSGRCRALGTVFRAVLGAVCAVLFHHTSFGNEPVLLTNISAPLKLLPPPWTNGERMRLNIKQGAQARIGVIIYVAEKSDTEPGKVWKLSTRMFAGIEHFSAVDVEADSARPLHSRWNHGLLGRAEARYSTNRAYVTIQGRGDKALELQGSVYDNEEIVALLRRLPLQTNYSSVIHVVSTLPQGVLFPLSIAVVGVEKAWVSAGEFDCFKVQLSNKQTYWISSDAHRYVVRMQTGSVEAELESIDTLNPNEPVTYHGKESGLQMTVPPRWYVFEASPGELLAKVYLLDPEAAAHTWVRVWRKESLREEDRDSLRQWAQDRLPEGSPYMKDLFAEKPEWGEQTLAGATGISTRANFLEQQDKKVVYQVVGFVGPGAVEFGSHILKQQSETLLPALKSIVDSLSFRVER